MLKLRPPQHTPDDEALYISKRDPAWDFEKIEAEREGLREEESHPLDIWYGGATRYSLEAKITCPAPRRAATIGEYLRPGEEATRFVIRPLGARLRQRVTTMVAGDNPGWVFEAVKAGLVEIRQGEEVIDVTDTEETLNMLDAVDVRLLQDIAVAIHILTYKQGGDVEGKR